jgi:hypothetical protein
MQSDHCQLFSALLFRRGERIAANPHLAPVDFKNPACAEDAMEAMPIATVPAKSARRDDTCSGAWARTATLLRLLLATCGRNAPRMLHAELMVALYEGNNEVERVSDVPDGIVGTF